MHKDAGFTLVEVIVSTIIFSLVILGLMSVFVASNKHLIHTRERTTSAELGKFFLDPLQGQVRQDTWDSAVPPVNELRLGSRPGTTQTINGRQFGETHVVTNVGNNTDLRRVVSKITWTEPQS